MRKALIAVFLVLVGIPFASPATAAPPLVGALKAGEFVFWQGSQSRASGDIFEYQLELRGSGARLRVAIDTPARADAFELAAVSPAGTATSVQNTNKYNAEVFVAKPVAGIWTIRVRSLNSAPSAFRLRARLEAVEHQPRPDAKGLLLPNLRMEPPFELGFVAPAMPTNGFMPDAANPPLDAAGVHPLSCTAHEKATDGAARCLRFSFGLGNAGDGNFDVRFDFADDKAGGKPPRMLQCIQRGDGKLVAHEAGEYTFHDTHGHFHYEDVVLHELLRVPDPNRRVAVAAGLGKKTGYQPADQSFSEWNRFVQAAPGTSASAGDCYPGGASNRLGLSRGWGDAYRWQRPGNYVEFGTNPDGWYVVRTTADPLNHVLESDKSDNTAYTYVRVVGESVQVLEQGIGQGPFDPRKRTMTWPARASAY